MRSTIAGVVPKVTEVMSYGMPAFKLHGVLVWFAAYKKHIGFYPRAEAIIQFNKELKPFKQSKGAIQFQLTEPLPIRVIKKIVQYRVKEDQKKYSGK
jgi:uncharacterized protein YdhG (YjbR/CyaY superfamily)